MGEREQHRYVFKVVVIGDGAVGKTSLINRFAEQKFIKEYKPTLGTNIVIKEIQENNNNNNYIRLLLWDIAGQAKWKDVRHLYYQGASSAILVFDITRKETFNDIPEWFDDLLKYSGEIPRILIANKIDLENLKKVTTDQIKEMADKVNASKFFQTSAADGTNVLHAFTYLAKLMIKKE
ncbi:MAG: GTP-binding protein [Candidatus Lokiarchaeota archaeon]|nr:GTP-binding protein [Candidatus Lokiarchaeota archaeon]